MEINKRNTSSFLEKISKKVSIASGSSGAFILAFSTIILWAILGPVFNFSDTWQLVINTSTTIVTFLMVFLIQRSQNRDSIALHLKLNELIISQKLANNHMVDVENISEKELNILLKYYSYLANASNAELPIAESHTLKKANAMHEMKTKLVK